MKWFKRMQNTESVQNWGRSATVYDVKIVIAGLEYGADQIISLRTDNSLFRDDKAGIGGVNAGQISLVLRCPEDGAIPRAAEMKPFVRKRFPGGEVSGWLPSGVFYIDTREKDQVTGELTITGYDAMLKAEDAFLRKGDQGMWPMADLQVVDEICSRMGVILDPESRETMTGAWLIQYPSSSESAEDGYTCRELLSYIAVMYGANWTMDEVGNLRLVPLTKLPQIIRYLADENGNSITFGGVRILV